MVLNSTSARRPRSVVAASMRDSASAASSNSQKRLRGWPGNWMVVGNACPRRRGRHAHRFRAGDEVEIEPVDLLARVAGRAEHGRAADGELEAALEPLGDPAVRSGAEGDAAPARRTRSGPRAPPSRRRSAASARRPNSASVPPAAPAAAAATASPSANRAAARASSRGESGVTGNGKAARSLTANGLVTTAASARPASSRSSVLCAGPAASPAASASTTSVCGEYGSTAPLSGFQPSRRASFCTKVDLHGRARVLAGQLAELPLAREHPERVLHRRGQPAPRIAATRNGFDPGE